MKRKTFSKLLTLKKTTIANLMPVNMKVIKGGETTEPICFPTEAASCDLTCQTTTAHETKTGGTWLSCVAC